MTPGEDVLQTEAIEAIVQGTATPMVTILHRQRYGYDVRMYPRDHDPPHVHVWKGGRQIKIDIDMKKIPFVHDDRCAPQAVRFTNEHVMIEMADGRIIGLPLDYFPWLLNASEPERQNYQLNYYTVDWLDMDQGIDMVAMLTGLYLNEMPRQTGRVVAELAAT